ncbi:MMPL family transporter [Nocardia salmonicida]|uniref:MMPL family transporter n=2 Tax=Nocardia salmonicida TaxID=53431 RepID=UPI000AF707FE|nr:MMPL family transporter [Nocardia salmonicida]
MAAGRPKTVVAVIALVLVLAGAGGASLQQRLSGGGFWNADAESARSARVLAEKYTTGTPNVIVLVDVAAASGTVDTPSVATTGLRLTTELATVAGVRSVSSYWSTGSPEFLRSADRGKALVAVDVPGDEIVVDAVVSRLIDSYRDRDYGEFHLRLGGAAVSYHDVTEQLSHDMKVTEAVTIPILLVLLVLIFGSLVAAGLPLVLGLVSIIGTLEILRLLTEFTQVSSYALNLTTVLGLGLGIDYSLFLVSRFREERHGARDVPTAVRVTVTTAGRTVLFSAATIVIAMLAMLPELTELTQRIQHLDHVRLVRSLPGPEGAHLMVIPDLDPYSLAAETLLDDIRRTDSPAPLLVGGATAENADTKSGLAGRLPLVVALIVVAMLVLLFAFTGSVVIPLKAVLLNTLSLSATFGAMVYIFQDGHLKWLVGDFTETGYLAAPVPVLVFCLAFGLSMDYEVFLLSRIAEEHRARGVTADAVAYGLERTGRIVTAAAALMAIVCVGLAFSEVAFTKLMGVGLTLAVLMDATVVRGVLVPAFMRLLGTANWWAPAFLRRVHRHIAVREN